MKKSLLVGSLCSAMILSASMAAAADNWVGTWRLNVEKSNPSPGPGLKSLPVKFQTTPAGIKLTSGGVNAEGKATHGTYTAKWDGKDVPWQGNPDADTASPQKIPNT